MDISRRLLRRRCFGYDMEKGTSTLLKQKEVLFRGI